MKEKTNTSTLDTSKRKFDANPNQPNFTQDQLTKNLSNQKESIPQPQKEKQEAQPLEAAKGNDEIMSQPPQPAAPKIPKAPRIDADLKLALSETAQEEINEVMTKREAAKLIAKDKSKDL